MDPAMASSLKCWKELCLHISGYDINCQYQIHFKKRMAWLGGQTGNLPSVSGARFPTTLVVVGKFHLPTHKASCHYKYSYHWLPGVGMMDGEALEHIWTILNDIEGSIHEMTVGHCHNIINNHHLDMNVQRTHSIGACISRIVDPHMAPHVSILVKATSKKYNQAQTEYIQAKDTLQHLETQIEASTLAKWKIEELKWLEKVVDIK